MNKKTNQKKIKKDDKISDLAIKLVSKMKHDTLIFMAGLVLTELAKRGNCLFSIAIEEVQKKNVQKKGKKK